MAFSNDRWRLFRDVGPWRAWYYEASGDTVTATGYFAEKWQDLRVNDLAIHVKAGADLDQLQGQLRALVAVVEEGSFSAAARKLKRVQSAISTSMANLETQLGVRLFQRTTRRVSPTTEGHALCERARADERASAAKDLAASRREESHSMSVRINLRDLLDAARHDLRLAARRRDVMSTRLGHAVTAARKHMRSARTYRELYWHAHGQVTEARRLTLALKEAVMPGRTIAATAPARAAISAASTPPR